jgi:hypothetical protein
MSNESAERVAILCVMPEVLQALLQLPAGSHIDGLQAPLDRPGCLEIRLRGAGWPTPVGNLLQRTVGTISATVDESGLVTRTSIDWGLPPGSSTHDPKN